MASGIAWIADEMRSIAPMPPRIHQQCYGSSYRASPQLPQQRLAPRRASWLASQGVLHRGQGHRERRKAAHPQVMHQSTTPPRNTNSAGKPSIILMPTSSKKVPGSPNTNSKPAVQFLRRYSIHGLEVLGLDMHLSIAGAMDAAARKKSGNLRCLPEENPFIQSGLQCDCAGWMDIRRS